MKCLVEITCRVWIEANSLKEAEKIAIADYSHLVDSWAEAEIEVDVICGME